MLKLDKKTIADLEARKIQKIKVFFYNGGCSGTKVDILEDNFEVDETVTCIYSPPLQGGVRGGNILIPHLTSTPEYPLSCNTQDSPYPHGGEEKYPFDVYVEKQDFEKFEFATITRLVKADHTGEAKSRYIYTNDAILDRCGCGTSFSFEKKKPKINLEKLKTLKIDIVKK